MRLKFYDLAYRQGEVTPLAETVKGFYDRAVADGHGERLLSELLAPEPCASGESNENHRG